jgi:hypothetical protein
MAIFETFSKRQKRLANAGQPDVYIYDYLPEVFCVQVVHILRSSIGNYFGDHYRTKSADVWDRVHKVICKEHGLFSLGSDPFTNCQEQCTNYIRSAEVENALDAIEICFKAINHFVRGSRP